MPNPSVSIGIVTWNSGGWLEGCAQGIAGQTLPPTDIVVVDNASADDSAARAARLWPAASVLRNPRNLGFAAGHNRAIRVSRGRYYLALNPDVSLGPRYLESLVAALEGRPDYGMAGGRLVRGDGRLDGTGLWLDARRRQRLRGHGEPDHGQYHRPGEVFGIDGAAPLYRRAMLDDVAHDDGQFFDELFDTYKEDVDLAWRARLYGWRAWYEPAAGAVHPRTFRPGTRAGSERTRMLSVRNRYLLLAKNELGSSLRRDAWRIASYDAAIAAFLLFRERASLAALPGLLELRSPLRARRAEVMRRIRVPRRDIAGWFPGRWEAAA